MSAEQSSGKKWPWVIAVLILLALLISRCLPDPSNKPTADVAKKTVQQQDGQGEAKYVEEPGPV